MDASIWPVALIQINCAHFSVRSGSGCANAYFARVDLAMSHAVSRLRDERLARSTKPFIARGSRAPRCPDCRVIFSYCLCAWRPRVQARSAVCLLMYDTEPLKPTNTGWLIADVIEDTHAFGWSRIEVDEQLLGHCG